MSFGSSIRYADHVTFLTRSEFEELGWVIWHVPQVLCAQITATCSDSIWRSVMPHCYSHHRYTAPCGEPPQPLAAGARLCTGSRQSPVSSSLSALPHASQDLKYGGPGANASTVAINGAGVLLFAALFLANQRAADTRIMRRDAV